jgi:hypothetical protein
MANALVSYKEKAERLSTQLRNLKEASAAPLRAMMHTGSGAIGGVVAGALDAKLPNVGPVPTVPALGGVMCLGAWLNAKEDWSYSLNAFGTTMIGIALARETYRVITAPPSHT